jgi:hypothetical protein
MRRGQRLMRDDTGQPQQTMSEFRQRPELTPTFVTALSSGRECGELTRDGLRRFRLARLLREPLRDNKIQLMSSGAKWSQIQILSARPRKWALTCGDRLGNTSTMVSVRHVGATSTRVRLPATHLSTGQVVVVGAPPPLLGNCLRRSLCRRRPSRRGSRLPPKTACARVGCPATVRSWRVAPAPLSSAR